MKGVFVRLERNELKDIVSEMLEANTALVHLSLSTSNLKKIRKEKINSQREFLMAGEELDLEIEKIRAMLPSVEMTGQGRFEFKPQKPVLRIKKSKSTRIRKNRHEAELENIRKRLEEIRMK